MAFDVVNETQAGQENPLTRKALLEQLQRVVASSHFRNSKRYPSFLKFIVERTVEGNTEVLKERNLGTEVFGRPSDYDTSADPIVRVTAGEVRKRIAQYYQTAGHEQEVRIDLPLGSYVPHFYPPGHASGTETESKERNQTLEGIAAAGSDHPVGSEVLLPNREESVLDRLLSTRKRLLFGLGGVAVLAASVGAFFATGIVRNRSQSRGVDYIWQSFTPATNSLIVMGVHVGDATGKAPPANPGAPIVRNEQQNALDAMEASDMVPVSDVVSYSRITDLLTRRSVTYRTKSSTDTTLDELRAGPVVLVGAFNNIWTMRLASKLRYRPVPVTATVNAIQDSQHPATAWAFDNLEPAIVNSTDYAIVASYYDRTIEQHVVIAAGIGRNGTTAASEFLTSNKDLKDWLTQAKVPADKNVELVLSTDVLDGEPGPPHIIAVSIW